ncbi:hypothetical protein GCM10007939_18910 [Amylibacter marinus]|uniref:Reductive dehalogenase n=1 Tax=Amylibacter marinus TaxID=1475483 RepID=A0ABQ5VWY2_9RHOB|nr:4Fe-4S dicluster domain-containing protein [Amylibacter marinus]GLQ35608.1 hypothetical protein GCM10007939_18910 [Amylibacter marinus]
MFGDFLHGFPNLMRIFSDKNRAPHLGPYPLERLARRSDAPDLSDVSAPAPLSFDLGQPQQSITHAMRDYQAMMDAIRTGLINKGRSEIPNDPIERAQHFKSFAYFQDVSMVGIACMTHECRLDQPLKNPDVAALAQDLQTKQTKTFAAGMDVIMAELKDAVSAPPTGIDAHSHALVFLHEYPRDPASDEVGAAWIQNAQPHRAALLGAEVANVVANYIRLLGHDARAHSATASEVNVNRLAVLAGLATWQDGALHNPYLGTGFGISVVTTTLDMAADLPLAAMADQPRRASHGLAWKIGKGSVKSALNSDPFKKRRFVDGPYPFEKIKRVDTPTTLIDEPNIPRVPKRADLFARAQFGDLGPAVADGARNGHYVRKTAPSSAQRKPMSAFVLLQNKERASHIDDSATDPQINADNIKATSYFLGLDAVGISRAPEWAFYSHDATGTPIETTHTNAISMIVDQRFDTMDGSSGDDWISVALSMRAYLRFSLLGGVIAEQIRALGYSAKAHTATDSDVIQPPLLLLAGLGEVSRIGEVILNPFLGPRLKSGVITTDMPLAHDKPIDFGMQNFCNSCNKCARECPSGAITAGPKKMFNGYEIWKSDSQRCATYRITSPDGAMCGRCMKTCPWNLEGLFAEAPFRWAATHIPKAAPLLARLDDRLGNGGLNPAKKWWWDLEIQEDEGFRPTQNGTHQRDLQVDLKIDPAEQTLAVYPADQAPPPWPFPFPMDREQGIQAYQELLSPEEYRTHSDAGTLDQHLHKYTLPTDSPALQTRLSRVTELTPNISLYDFTLENGADLPEWTAGAHIDVVIAPGFIRQYSLCGDPADRSRYQIAVLREDAGKGGSKLLHKIFTLGRRVFISKPINHFPLVTPAAQSILMGGGIGITPMIAMAHQAHALGLEFQLHYCCSRKMDAGFGDILAQMPWADRVTYHFSDTGTRADLSAIMRRNPVNTHLYTCGPDRFMDAVMDAGAQAGLPDDHRHLEYFSAPEAPEYENHPFVVQLANSGQTFDIPADQSITEVLAAHNIPVNTKCSDGICGVCKCGYSGGDIEHRDFVLSNKQRETAMIPCQSRAATIGAKITLDL